ncbi:MAG: T9SS type A sorting domain-containing protein [Bacteroidales bacterium]|nr:T9SS type A sorting domain-containing protein [Bacteroidales bacterium]
MKNPFLINCFLIVCNINIVLAQQGSVATGGEATGTGGTLSYSVGQTDYLVYSSEHGSLSFGLQQSWTLSVPPLLEIPAIIISDNEALCFNATETVIVAGDGKHFIVQDGGNVDIIAGQNILMKYGTSVESGGNLHAYISDVWCEQPESLLASFFEEPLPTRQIVEPETNDSFFKIYPNPTTGDFTLELLEFEEYSNIKVEIYSAQGHLVLGKELPAKKLYHFNLTERQPGIYMVSVLKDKEIGVYKIIKQ